MFGKWKTSVAVNQMPQKVASAFGQLNALLGVRYTPIAYLGSQLVNGTNHAVLAEQTIVTGKDSANVVLVIFNEKPEGVAVTNIERVVEGDDNHVDVQTTIPQEAQNAFDKALGEFVGATVEPFAQLATKAAEGTDYILAATVTPVSADPKVAIVTVNAVTRHATFVDLLPNKNGDALGYAFTWL